MEKQKLFVGNINFETTEEEIISLFSTFGTVKSLRFRQKKGTAFVEMSKPEEAEVVMQNLDQSEYKNRILRISLELPKKKARAMTRQRRKDNSKKDKLKNNSDSVELNISPELSDAASS